VRVLLPLVELAVSEADRTVGMTDDRPHMVISTLRRFVSGELTRAEAQRELDALKLREREPSGEWGGGAAQAPYFAYGAARHLAEVFRRSAKAADLRRLVNERIWTRCDVDLALRRLGETEESSEAIMRNVLGREIGEAR
jgi:MoxR-like ATPase